VLTLSCSSGFSLGLLARALLLLALVRAASWLLVGCVSCVSCVLQLLLQGLKLRCSVLAIAPWNGIKTTNTTEAGGESAASVS
jgi:hypothetical protein